MDLLIVGKAPLDLKHLLKELEKSDCFKTVCQHWKEFGTSLGVDDVKLLDLENKYLHNNLQLRSLPREIIITWVAGRGSDAKWRLLHDALVNCGCTQVAESLIMKLITPAESIKTEFTWNGKELDKLWLGANEKFTQEIHQSICRGEMEHGLVELIRPQVTPPPKPKYYIPRTLEFPSTELDTNVFNHESSTENVFLFEGIDKSELVKTIGHRPIELSGDQLDSLTAKFILLECDDDFDTISKITNQPVHVVQYDNGRYSWVRSSSNLNLIRKFLIGQGQEISEHELVSHTMSMSPPCTFSISDSPGMGKTLVLAELTNLIQQSYGVLFIVLQEFAQHLSRVDSRSSALESVAEYAATNQVAKLVLTEMLQDLTRHFYLFADGYDEVVNDKVGLVDSFLKQVKQLPNVKLIITTRPHLRTNLEVMFNRLSYNIKPFDKSNQIDFLVSYWVDKHGGTKSPPLEEFARQCLSAVETTLTDKEKDIAGIPLQCMMLAEVYAKMAVRASKLKAIRDDIVKINSLFDMYKMLCSMKLERAPEGLEGAYKTVHVRFALELLFPEWLDTFDSILRWNQSIKSITLYWIGLVELRSNLNSPRFVHRTFAEYLVAEFIVENLDKHSDCFDLLFGEIFGRKGTALTWSHKFLGYKLKYPVTAYFIDMQLKEYVNQRPRPSELTSLNFNVEDVCVGISCCCRHDLPHAFGYFANVLDIFRVGNELKNKHMIGLAYVVVLYSNNLDFLKEVMELNKKTGVGLDYNVTRSPLHQAFRVGKCNMACCLVEQYGDGDRVKKLRQLLHSCVEETAEESSVIIKEKLLIIDLLVGINKEWIHERDYYDRTPLLQQNVHLDLLQRLVELGADVNACTRFFGTVLHTSDDKSNYAERVHWALKHGFRMINERDYRNRTPLMHAIEIGVLDNTLLSTFLDTGADVNAIDTDGYSVLRYALKYSGGLELIRKLLEYWGRRESPEQGSTKRSE